MKKYIYQSFICLLFLLASCDSYLDLSPIDKPSSGTFLSNEDELLIAVNGCYNPLWERTDGNVSFYHMLYAISDLGTNRLSGGAAHLLANGSISPDNSWLLTHWKTFYSGIASCNYLLENMNRAKENSKQETFSRIEGEARFLRAFYYSYLNELWGGVPLLKNTIKLDEAQMQRSTKEEVTLFILNELEAAAAVLPWEYGNKDTGRATRGAALALHSRIALYNGKWDEAIKSSKQIIDAKMYSLHNHYGDLFLYAGENSKEIIFAIQYQLGGQVVETPFRNLTRMGGGTSERFPLLALVDSYECIDGKSIDKSPLYDPINPEKNRDPRLGYTVVMPNTVFWGYQFETHADSLLCWNYSVSPAKRVANQDVTNSYATASGFNWKKYVDPKDIIDRRASELNFTLIRYAEVLLNYAEAKIEKGEIDQAVYDAINLVRQRPTVNMPPILTGKSQTEMRSIIRKERKYELAGEGLRLFDIRRWKIAEEVMQGTLYGRPKIKKTSCWMKEPPVIDQWGTPHYDNISNKADLRILDTRVFNKNKDYLWPIPQLELDTNEKLEQNPNW